MNLDQYQHLVQYLDTDEIPPNFTENEKRTIVKQSRYYYLENRILYKKNRKDPKQLIRVIKWTEVEPILYMMHSHSTAGHLETDAMYYKISERYYWD